MVCHCEANEIMAKTKAKPKATGTAVPEAMDAILSQMVAEMEASTGDDKKDGIRRDCLIKFETVKKYVAANW